MDSEWTPEAEWVFEAMYRPEMTLFRVTELHAPNEAIATLFGFRYLREEGWDTSQFFKIRVERVSE